MQGLLRLLEILPDKKIQARNNGLLT